MPVIGLTGSIASGKSLVSRILKEMGIRVIDADLVAREAVKPGLPAWQKIKEDFGDEVLNTDLTLNRKLLGSKVFGNPELLNKLNSITHPVIIEKINSEIAEFRSEISNQNNLLVVDAPLLIETGLHDLVDWVWLVYLPKEIQIKRLMLRDDLNHEQALKRIRSQMSGEQKKEYAHAVIDNSGSMEETREKVRQVVKAACCEIRGGEIEDKQK